MRCSPRLVFHGWLVLLALATAGGHAASGGRAPTAETVGGCPLPPTPGDPCALAPACLRDLPDSEAAAWLAAAVSPLPPLVFEPWPSNDELLYPDIWFLGPAGQRSFEADEPADWILKLTGTIVGGTEFQTLDPISPLAREKIRGWVRFRHSTRCDLLNDTTVGFEHFNLDMKGGFRGIDPIDPCYLDCELARQGGDQCQDGPPVSCTPEMATDEAHFALLLDLDQNPATIPPANFFTGLFADGSACGHLACSPWGSVFEGQSAELDPGLWHLVLIEYRPAADAGIRFCFDGAELGTGSLSALLTSSLLDALIPTLRPLRLRVSANREGGATEDQMIEVDWFAIQTVPIFGDGFETGDTARWSASTP